MTSTTFTIDSVEITSSYAEFPFTVQSFPYPYDVAVITNVQEYFDLVSNADFIIIDKNIFRIYPLPQNFNGNIFVVDAKEENKVMDTVLSLVDSLIDHNISKGSSVLAIGGGIVQDISACACALFRRGQPFTYLPTTSLGQLDSCVGAKCAMNTSKAKNIIGLFSAPRKVIIPAFMIKSMSLNDHRAGLSEMLRLCLTASDSALDSYKTYFEHICHPDRLDLDTYSKALSLSLSIKKAVVDFDEYERNIRKSMNFGHTFGHALEKLVDFTIPHGIAVLIGMHIANHYSFITQIMDSSVFANISNHIQLTIKDVELDKSSISNIDPLHIIDQFKYDKKGDGSSVPLILIKKPGTMIFHRYSFDSDSSDLVQAISLALNDIIKWLI